MKKLTSVLVAATVGVLVGMTGVASASAAAGQTFSKRDMYACAGAVMQADTIISGGDKSALARVQFIQKRKACEKAVGGF